MNFKLGIIDSFKPSRDSAKRIANVHYVINGKINHVRRPNNKLYPVECNKNQTEVGKQLLPFHMEYLFVYGGYEYFTTVFLVRML